MNYLAKIREIREMFPLVEKRREYNT